MYTYIRIEVGLLGQAEGRQRGFWKRPSSSSSLCLWFVLSSSFIYFFIRPFTRSFNSSPSCLCHSATPSVPKVRTDSFCEKE